MEPACSLHGPAQSVGMSAAGDISKVETIQSPEPIRTQAHIHPVSDMVFALISLAK